MTASTWVDLSQVMYPGIPGAKAHGEFEWWVDRPEVPEHIELRISHISTAIHMGTHMDAAAHFIPGGKTIEEYETDHFIGPGVVLDLRREGVVPIDAADLEQASPGIRDGDIVFIWTGYAEKVGSVDIHATGHPHLTEDAARWLVDRGVRLIGIDVFTPDLPGNFRPEGFDWPVHQILLGNDTLIIENLGTNLERVAGHRVDISAVPVRVAGAEGGFVVPLARITD